MHSYEAVTPRLAAAGYRVIVPHLRGYGTTRFLSDGAVRNGEQAALALDVVALMDALGINTAIVAGFDWGARSANIVAALWPERVSGLVSVSGYLIGSQEAGKAPLPPAAELQWWYQYYFATERGRAGYDKYRYEFARLIWRTASPKWSFDDETFNRSSASLDNPDHVAIVTHNYRWRLGVAEGEPEHRDLERRLAGEPVITVPTITLEGDANGAPHPEPEAYATKFSGPYAHRMIEGGVGHNLPQEAPAAFVDAIRTVGEWAAPGCPDGPTRNHTGATEGPMEHVGATCQRAATFRWSGHNLRRSGCPLLLPWPQRSKTRRLFARFRSVLRPLTSPSSAGASARRGGPNGRR
jgi:pimeloyl-ACP methyl ester carboxylesterase